MDDGLDKVAGKIDPEPTAQEVEDALKRRAARPTVTAEQMRLAAKNLGKLMKTQEMQRIGWVMQFGYRLTQWAQMEASGVQGMNELTLVMLVQAQEQAARDAGFDFQKVVADFKGKQLRWVEERLRESEARRVSRERRVKKLKQQLRRQDIPLPFHSLRAMFDEKGFTHEDSLSLVGHAEGVRPMLRLIAAGYQRAGGSVLFLTENDKPEPSRFAKLSMPILQWLNSCQILARVTETLDPVLKRAKTAPGLVIVDNLDRALAKSEMGLNRPGRLERAFALLKQYQSDRGFALVVGVHTDEDPEGVDPLQIYPPLLLNCPFVQVKVEKSEIVDWSKNVVIGNDTITLDELTKKVEGDKKG